MAAALASGTVGKRRRRPAASRSARTRLLRRQEIATQATWKGSRMAEVEFVRRLGELGYGRDDGRVGVLDLLARAGLPLPEGVVLTRRAHEEFLRTSGASRDIQIAARRGEDARRQAARIHSGRASYPIEGGLNRAICEALTGLHARAVVVLSEGLERGGLRSIPEVKDAVRDAWLSRRGLERQVEAAARGEDLPTWPVLVQREPRTRYLVGSPPATMPGW